VWIRLATIREALPLRAWDVAILTEPQFVASGKPVATTVAPDGQSGEGH
jgi:hypothetical protein